MLTKPLGIGIITTAIKRGKCPPDLAERATELMASLNRDAGAALYANRASAATDVTGFGLLGHLRELLDASGVGAEIVFDQVPVLDGVHELLEKGMWAGGSNRNYASVRGYVSSDLGEAAIKVLADAQTSGGLAVALPEDAVGGYLRAVPGAGVIGSIKPGPGVQVR